MSAKHSAEKDYDDIPRHLCVRRRALAPGLRHQHVLHVADEGGEPQGLQGQRGGIPQEVSADAGAARGDPQARLQPDAGTRRQHLFHRQARRHRRPFVPAPRRGDDRLDAGGLRRHDAGRRPLGRRQPQQVGQIRQSRVNRQSGESSNRNPARERNAVARIIAGVASSHVPAIGAAIDNKQTEEPYWKRVFSGFEKSKEWMAKAKPDVVIGVYNDHASAFSVEIMPTFALGCAAEFPPPTKAGAAAGAGGEGPSRACLAHRAIGHPRRVRSHHRATRWRSTTA